MKAQHTTRFLTAAGFGVIAAMANGCVTSVDEDIDADLDAEEQRWAEQGDHARDNDDTAVREVRELRPNRRLIPQGRSQRDTDLHLQPCYELGAPCDDETVCRDTEWGLYCVDTSFTALEREFETP